MSWLTSTCDLRSRGLKLAGEATEGTVPDLPRERVEELADREADEESRQRVHDVDGPLAAASETPERSADSAPDPRCDQVRDDHDAALGDRAELRERRAECARETDRVADEDPDDHQDDRENPLEEYLGEILGGFQYILRDRSWSCRQVHHYPSTVIV